VPDEQVGSQNWLTPSTEISRLWTMPPRPVWVPEVRPCRGYESERVPAAIRPTSQRLSMKCAPRSAAEEARAASTERAYAADWRDFSAFCARIGREHLPAEPETITLYLADLMHCGRVASTWERRLAAIAAYHRATGFESPTEHEVVRSVHRGLRRRAGVAQSQKPR
jgi:hypothetical protein